MFVKGNSNEIKYQMNITLICSDCSDENGIVPLVACNSFKMWLKKYEDTVECTKFELIPRIEDDHFARQRKWIGKVVKGWQDNDNDLPPIYGILDEIHETCHPAFLVNGSWCYRVSPVDESELAKD